MSLRHELIDAEHCMMQVLSNEELTEDMDEVIAPINGVSIVLGDASATALVVVGEDHDDLLHLAYGIIRHVITHKIENAS